MVTGWRIGHKDILCFMQEHFNVYSWQTVRRWKRKGMPIHRLWSDKPYIIPNEVIKWQKERKIVN
jgi:hypothetical protein